MKTLTCGMIVRLHLMVLLALSATYLHGQNKTVINIGEGSGSGSVGGTCVCDTIKMLGSNQASTSTTYAVVSDLTFNVESGSSYFFDSYLFFDTVPDGGIKITIDGSATVSMFNAWNEEPIVYDYRKSHTLGSDIYSKATSYTPEKLFKIRASLTASGSGTIGIQFAQVDGDGGTTTMLAGSFAQLKLSQ